MDFLKKNSLATFMVIAIIAVAVVTGILNEDISKKSKKDPGNTSMAFSRLSTLGFNGRFFIFQNHKLTQVVSGSPNEITELWSFPSDVIGVTVSPSLQHYAYISSGPKDDMLHLYDRRTGKDETAFTARHDFTGEQETQSTRLVPPIRFSPDGAFVVARQIHWEGCTDLVFAVATKRQVSTNACESIVWPSNGRHVAIGNGQNYDGPIQFAVSSTPSPASAEPIDWQKVDGGSIFLDAQGQPIEANVYPAFEGDDHIILLVESSSVYGVDTSWLYRFSITSSTLERMTSLPGSLRGGIFVVGRQVLIVNANGRFVVNLDTNKVSTVTSGLDNPGHGMIQFFALGDGHILMVNSTSSEDWRSTDSSITIIDPIGGMVQTEYADPGVSFGGWSPLTAIPSNADMLKAAGVAPLTKKQRLSLDHQIENIAEYVPSSTKIGDSTCGSSANHDRLLEINRGSIQQLDLAGGYRILATPNSQHWSWLDALNFAHDPTIICGVGTFTPAAVNDAYVFWTEGCGGVGISDPKNIEQVGCLQGEGVFYQHFGIE